MRWQKKLTKAELKHVREWAGTTLTAIKSGAKYQKKIRDEGRTEPCYICLGVSRKLGLEV